MNKSFNRRAFLRSSIQSLGMLALFSTPLKGLSTLYSSDETHQNNYSPSDLDQLYKEAKDYFYQKKYSTSVNLYKELIAKTSDKIYYYDGYASVLGAQQDLLSIAELYRQGLEVNPNNPFFMHRLSLSIRNLCTGSRKAEHVFMNKYGEDNLMSLSAALLVEAVEEKPSQGFLMDLKDFPVVLEKLNYRRIQNELPPFSINDELSTQINGLTQSIVTKWEETRRSRKPFFGEVETDIKKINEKKRRTLYSDDEKKSRNNSTLKAKKERWKTEFSKSLKVNNINQVEKYAAFILVEDIRDTDTIGKMRKFYNKNKDYNRLIALNRKLYTANPSYINAITLAGTLVKHGNSGSDVREVKQLLAFVEPYAETLPVVNTTSYYMTCARLNLKEDKPEQARECLLKGIKLYDGRGGLSYSMMELYALTFMNSEPQKGIAIMKKLTNKKSEKITTEIDNYITNYWEHLTEKETIYAVPTKARSRAATNSESDNEPTVTSQSEDTEKERSIQEKIKALTALFKLQKIAGDAGYNATISEINTLKSQMNIHG